jgi:hypothetical protein
MIFGGSLLIARMILYWLMIGCFDEILIRLGLEIPVGRVPLFCSWTDSLFGQMILVDKLWFGDYCSFGFLIPLFLWWLIVDEFQWVVLWCFDRKLVGDIIVFGFGLRVVMSYSAMGMWVVRVCSISWKV